MGRVLHSSFRAPRSGTSATQLPARGPRAEHRVSVHHQDSVIDSGSGGGAPGGILTGGEGNSWPPGTEAWTPRAAHTTTALCTGPRVPLSGRGQRTGSTCSLHPIRTRNASDGLGACSVGVPRGCCLGATSCLLSRGEEASRTLLGRLPGRQACGEPPTTQSTHFHWPEPGLVTPAYPAGEAGKLGLPGIQEKEMGLTALCQFLQSLVSKQF